MAHSKSLSRTDRLRPSTTGVSPRTHSSTTPAIHTPGDPKHRGHFTHRRGRAQSQSHTNRYSDARHPFKAGHAPGGPTRPHKPALQQEHHHHCHIKRLPVMTCPVKTARGRHNPQPNPQPIPQPTSRHSSTRCRRHHSLSPRMARMTPVRSRMTAGVAQHAPHPPSHAQKHSNTTVNESQFVFMITTRSTMYLSTQQF